MSGRSIFVHGDNKKKSSSKLKRETIGEARVWFGSGYFFLADGTMPVLDFEITQGKAPKNSEEAPAPQSEHLTLELYNPLSGEVFEAKFSKGRIEVDLDGTITYFSQSAERVSFSLFLGRSIIVTM